MQQRRLRAIIALSAACACSALSTSALEGQVGGSTMYTWNGPFFGTSDPTTPTSFGNANPWSNSNSWTGGMVPASSPFTQLVFPDFDDNAYTAYNDLAATFLLNSISINSWSTNLLTVASLSSGGNANQIELTGASPTITSNGPGSAIVGALTSSLPSAYGLVLAPSSGTTTVTGSGAGGITLGNPTNNAVTGSGGLTISQSGVGVVTLGGNNAFTGGVTLSNGALAIAGSGALGGNTLTINGGTLLGSYSLGSTTADTIPNPVTLNSTLNFGSSNALIISGNISGTGGVHVVSNNALTLSGTNTYTGATTVDSGVSTNNSSTTLTISPGASILNTASINLGNNSALLFTANNTAGSPFSSSTPIKTATATLALTGNSSTTSQSLGNLTTSGVTIFDYTPVSGSSPGAVNTLAFGNLIQSDDGGATNNHSTLFFRGYWTGADTSGSPLSNPTSAAATFSNGLTTSGVGAAAIVPYAAGTTLTTTPGSDLYVTPNAFVTYGASGVQLLPVTDSSVTQISDPNPGTTFVFSNSTNSPSATANVNITSPASPNYNYNVSDAETVNALAFTYAAGGTENLVGSGILTVSSGTVITSTVTSNTTGPGVSTFTGPTLDFGSATGYLHLGFNSSLRFTNGSKITGSGGVVFSSVGYSSGIPSIVSFSGSAADTFTGGLTLNGPVIYQIINDNELGASGGGITLNGGTVFYFPSIAGTDSDSRNIVLGPSGGSLIAHATDSGSGNIVAVSTLALSGTISGQGNLYINNYGIGTGITALTGTNTYQGSTVLSSGTLNITADANLGAGPVVFSGNSVDGFLQFASSATFNHTITAGYGTIDTNTFSPTWAGSISSVPGNAGGNLVKKGAGTFILTGDSPNYFGQITVNTGTFDLAGSATLPQVTTFNVNSATTLQIDNTTANNANRIGDLARIILTNGTLNYIGNPATPSTETFGSLYLRGTSSNTDTVNVIPATATLTAGIVSSKPVYNQNASVANAASAALTKTGPGTLLLGSPNTLTSGVRINGGAIKIGNAGALGFGAVTTTTIGSTMVNTGGSLDLSGTALTEPVTLSGGSLINSSATPAAITSGVKGTTINLTASSTAYNTAVTQPGSVAGASGMDYSAGDTVSITGTGTGATATPIFGLSFDSIQVTNGGDYESGAPTVTITGGGGTGATASVGLVGTSLTVTLTNPGSGYTSIPTITISTISNSSPATAQFTANPFALVGLQQTNSGYGYTTAPTYSLNSATGSGASFNSNGGTISSLALTTNSSIGGAGDISVAPGITGGAFSLTKIGTDNVTLNGVGTYTGGSNVAAGTLTAANSMALGSGTVSLMGGTLGLIAPETITNNVTSTTGVSGISVAVSAAYTTAGIGTLTVGNGTTVVVAATGSLAKPRTVLAPAGLSFVGTGTLDLTSNDLDLAGAMLTTINAEVRSGYAGGSWSGNGIISSSAANDSTHLTTLGVISNSPYGIQLYGSGGMLGLFDKSSPGASDILVKYTYYGDANLDGKVDGSDYSLIDNGVHLGLTGWYNGDFNYDGTINGSDYTLIDNAFNTQLAQLVAGATAQIATSTDQTASPASVPEPTAVTIIAPAVAGLLRRRRRSQRFGAR